MGPTMGYSAANNYGNDMNIWVSSGLTFFTNLNIPAAEYRLCLAALLRLKFQLLAAAYASNATAPQSCLQIIVVNAGTGAVMLQRQF